MELSDWIGLAIWVSVMLTVLSLGMRASKGASLYVLARPGLLARSLVSMYGIMPVLAVGAVLLFDFHPAVKVALVALSVSPVPPLLPRRLEKVGGNPEYTVGLLVAASIGAVVLIPPIVLLVGAILRLPLAMSALAVFRIVLVTVLGPLTVGLLLRSVAPRFSERAASPLSTAAFALLVTSVLPILATSYRGILSLVGNGTLLALAGFCLAGLAAGRFLGGPSSDHRLVLSFCTSSRHPGVAMAVASANFPENNLVPAAVFLYLVANAVIAFFFAARLRKPSREPPAVPERGGPGGLKPA